MTQLPSTFRPTTRVPTESERLHRAQFVQLKVEDTVALRFANLIL